MGALSSFAHFLYDKEEGTVLGRTFDSWLKITIFYAIYYTCIGAFAYYFVGGYQNQFMTLPDQSERARPMTQNRVATPGLATFPMREKIELDANRQNAIQYMDEVNEFLMSYNDDETKQSHINPLKLGECSPVCLSKDSACEETPLLRSYEQGEPCIMYSLNKVIGWKPFPIPDSLNAEFIEPRVNAEQSLIGSVVPRYDPDEIYVYCYDLDVVKGEVDTKDNEQRFTVKYFSSDKEIKQDHSYGSLNASKYPLWKPALDANAFVAAKISVKENYLGDNINVACQAYAGGLAPNPLQNQAMAVTIVNVEAAGDSTAVKINEAYHNDEADEASEE